MRGVAVKKGLKIRIMLHSITLLLWGQWSQMEVSGFIRIVLMLCIFTRLSSQRFNRSATYAQATNAPRLMHRYGRRASFWPPLINSPIGRFRPAGGRQMCSAGTNAGAYDTSSGQLTDPAGYAINGPCSGAWLGSCWPASLTTRWCIEIEMTESSRGVQVMAGMRPNFPLWDGYCFMGVSFAICR